MILSGQTYKCVSNETFDSVALNVYGAEKYACELLCANPSLCNITMFTGGEVLQLPVVEVSENEDGEEYAPTKAPWKE